MGEWASAKDTTVSYLRMRMGKRDETELEFQTVTSWYGILCKVETAVLVVSDKIWHEVLVEIQKNWF